MYAKLKIVGKNSAMIVIPASVLNAYELAIGDYIEVEIVKKLTQEEKNKAKKAGFVR